jgi:hypothetical protein
MVIATLFVFGIAATVPHIGDADTGKTVVMGIVEYARGDEVTVAGKTYDLTQAPFLDGHGLRLVDKPDLRGKTVELLIRNRKIESVTVYPTLPQ